LPWAAALLAGTIGLLGAAEPASAHSAARLEERATSRPAAASETVSIAKLVQTGSGDNNVVFNGEAITYTLIITNNSASHTAVNIAAQDHLPTGALDSISCLNPCDAIFTEQQIPEPLGGTLLVTTTTDLSWTVASLPPQASTHLVFYRPCRRADRRRCLEEQSLRHICAVWLV